MKKEQTAVEWIISEIVRHQMSFYGTSSIPLYIIEKAKQMEKEQHEETWFSSRVEDMGDDFKVEQKSFEDYYNETYGQTKN